MNLRHLGLTQRIMSCYTYKMAIVSWPCVMSADKFGGLATTLWRYDVTSQYVQRKRERRKRERASAEGASRERRERVYFPHSNNTWTSTQHTHPFNGPFSRTTRVSRYQKGKTNLDFNEARDSEWQWHQLGHMQVCTSLQTDNHASTPPLSFFTGRMPFLPCNQQRQSTEGKNKHTAEMQN